MTAPEPPAPAPSTWRAIVAVLVMLACGMLLAASLAGRAFG